MASHVPFLAVRPDDQFSTDIKTSAAATTNAIAPSVGMDPLDSPPALTRAPPTQEATRLPAAIRFPLVCVLSFTLSTLLHSLTSNFSGFQLATASKDLTDSWHIGLFLGWKIVELGIGWIAGYDYEDLAALTLLTNQPYYYLLYSFWSIQFVPVVISLAIDVVVITIPFALLRPLKRHYNARTTNQLLAMDWQILVLTALLGSTIYAVTFSLLHWANIGIFLITHFEDIPSLDAAHQSSIAALLQLFAITGVAAMFFLFRPAVSAANTSATDTKALLKKAKKFSPATASLGETFAYNLGYGENGWSHRAEVLAKRTLVLSACTLLNTFVRVFGTVQGTDIAGSLGYGGLWAGTTVLVAIAYGLIGNE